MGQKQTSMTCWLFSDCGTPALSDDTRAYKRVGEIYGIVEYVGD